MDGPGIGPQGIGPAVAPVQVQDKVLGLLLAGKPGSLRCCITLANKRRLRRNSRYPVGGRSEGRSGKLLGGVNGCSGKAPSPGLSTLEKACPDAASQPDFATGSFLPPSFLYQKKQADNDPDVVRSQFLILLRIQSSYPQLTAASITATTHRNHAGSPYMNLFVVILIFISPPEQ